MKSGQICHIDRDRGNNDPDNLVFLCLEHHDLYDSTTRQSKGFTKAELRFYRNLLAVDTEERLPRLERNGVQHEPLSAGYLQQVLSSIRGNSSLNACILNGFEIQKAYEKRALVIEPFAAEQLSLTSYELCVGDRAFVDQRELMLNEDGTIKIEPGVTAAIVTKEVIVMPGGLIGRIAPYYGASGIVTVDPGFRGSLIITVFNHRSRMLQLSRGDGIASLEFMLLSVPPLDWIPRVNLSRLLKRRQREG